MPGFFKKINTDYGVLEFHFIGINYPGGRVCFATVRAPSGKVHMLELRQCGYEWKLVSANVPSWLQVLEKELASSVEADSTLEEEHPHKHGDKR